MKKKQNRARGKCEYIQTKQTNIIKKCEKEKDRQGNPYTHTLLRRRRIYGKKKVKKQNKTKNHNEKKISGKQKLYGYHSCHFSMPNQHVAHSHNTPYIIDRMKPLCVQLFFLLFYFFNLQPDFLSSFLYSMPPFASSFLLPIFSSHFSFFVFFFFFICTHLFVGPLSCVVFPQKPTAARSTATPTNSTCFIYLYILSHLFRKCAKKSLSFVSR